MNNNQPRTNYGGSFFRANPVMNRVTKITERGAEGNRAGYGGVAMKTGFFLLMTVVGVIGYLVAQITVFQYQPQIEGLNYKGFEFALSMPQAMTLGVAAIVAIVAQLLAAFVPVTIPVTGTIYSLSQGVIISCLVFTILGGKNHMEHLGLLALAITIIVVVTMAFLYAKGIIKVTQKFRTILTTLALSMLGISLVALICAFIPGVNVFVHSILGNFWVSIGLALLSIIMTTLFMISEFAAVTQMVENQVPSKYEWNAAFGLAFSILWLYVKILDIIIQIVGRSNRSSGGRSR